MSLSHIDETYIINYLKTYFSEFDITLFKFNLKLYFLQKNSDDKFIIDLNDIYSRIGFINKASTKRLLLKRFTENTDYKITISHAGTIPEQILLTIDCFKNFCLNSILKSGYKVYNYYIKIEEAIIKYNNDLQLQQAKVREQLLIDKIDELVNLNKKLNNTINILIQKNNMLNDSILSLKQDITLFKSQYSMNNNKIITTNSNLKLEYTFLIFKNNKKSFNYITRIINILHNQDSINKITSNNEFKLITSFDICNNYINFIKLLYNQLSKILYFKAQGFTIIDKSINENKVIELICNLYNDWLLNKY